MKSNYHINQIPFVSKQFLPRYQLPGVKQDVVILLFTV